MAPELKRLAPEELDLLSRAPILGSILIAGADGNIDRSEIQGAVQTAQKKSRGKSSLQAYYQEVVTDFEDKLKVILHNYPGDAGQRNNEISHELTGLNSIFKKVEGTLPGDIYESLKNLAMNIAKSSGGIFGMSSIGPEEARYVDLNMIAPPSKT